MKGSARDKRNELILYLRKNSDLSIRDIAKLLCLGKSTVANVKGGQRTVPLSIKSTR